MSEGDGAASLADVQRQLAALESRYAALVAKHDDTENDLAFQRKRVESAVAKITQDKDDEIAQSAQHPHALAEAVLPTPQPPPVARAQQ